MVTKALGLWLFIVAIVWALAFVWIHLTMTNMTDVITPLPLYFGLGFGGPLLLTIGSTLLMALWHPRFASVLVLVACVWLTWEFAPAGFGMLTEARRSPDAPKAYYLISGLLLLYVILADIAAVLAFRHVRKTI
jgi:hypothetical protein